MPKKKKTRKKTQQEPWQIGGETKEKRGLSGRSMRELAKPKNSTKKYGQRQYGTCWQSW